MNCDNDLVAGLDSFDPACRRAALEALASAETHRRPARRPGEVNLHSHTSLSFNAYGFSPSRFAWEAYSYGLEVAGIVDFDVLDGVEEFLAAGRLLRLKTVAGFESRVIVDELKGKVTNSPNEPGVTYFITTGFVAPPPEGTPGAETLASMRGLAQQRNLRMTERVNAHLDPVTVDYERDVLPLTPQGNATERHILVAYDRRAREQLPDEDDLVRFWSEKLDEPLDDVRALLGDVVALKALVRRRLMKYGGVGYAAPTSESFPAIDDVLTMTLDCGAVPVGGWLDGTNSGEEDPVALMRLWQSKGIPTVSIVPDRNWNLKDPDEKALKVRKLGEAVDAAVSLQMPILVGTEMNADGQKFVDTFAAPELEPYRAVFLDGAHFAWGHTLLKMAADVGCTGEWADAHFGDDCAGRNSFFRQIGRADYPPEDVLSRLRDMGHDVTPEAALGAVCG